MSHSFLAIGASVLLSCASVAAQCSANEYPLVFVDRDGNLATSTRAVPLQGDVPQFSESQIYLSVPPDLPAGTYLVYVKDSALVESLSTLSGEQRLYRVSYSGGVQSVTPLDTTGMAPALGVGVGGAGFGIPLFPYRAPDTSLVGRNGVPEPCLLKAFIGSCYDAALENVFVGTDPVTGACCAMSFAYVAVGDLTPPDISGLVFADDDQDGVRDAGETGIPGQLISLDGPSGILTTSTGLDGTYLFPDVGPGEYTVSSVFTGVYFATTPTSANIVIDGCGSADAGAFGRAESTMNCAARTPGYWSSKHGVRLITADPSLLTGLSAFALVTETGAAFDPSSAADVREWLKARNARSMAYQLSGHLAAMYLNIEAGYVGASCMIADPQLGPMTIAQLMSQAAVALAIDPFTPSGDEPNRSIQERYKNALDRANNNTTWM